jgi:hypothetical protein
MATNLNLTLIAFLILGLASALVTAMKILDVCSERWITARLAYLEEKLDKLIERYKQFWHGEGTRPFDPIKFSIEQLNLQSQIILYRERLERVRTRKEFAKADHQKPA